MIVVRTYTKNWTPLDEAEAEDAEAAMTAAKTLCRDALGACQSTIGVVIRIQFLVDGVVVFGATHKEVLYA